jgi:flagellar biosynthetic protein FliR
MIAGLLGANVFQFLLAFSRVGAALMVMPFFSSSLIPMRMRLSFALVLSFLFLPFNAAPKPGAPDNKLVMSMLILKEILVGLFIGMIPASAMVAADIVGFAIANSSSFANGQAFDPSSNTQNIAFVAFFNFAMVTALLVTDMHHLMLGAIMDSYQLIGPTDTLMIEDMTSELARTLANSFYIGFKLGAPFLLLTVILNVLMAISNKLMPTLQVLFIMMPAQVYLGLSLLLLSFSAIMMWFVEHIEDVLLNYLK